MNILVTGANGQLGNEVRIAAKNSTDNYIYTDVVIPSEEILAMLKEVGGEDVKTDTEFLDITDLTDIRVFVDQHKIYAVINCVAYTNVDAAEDNEWEAEVLNTRAPEYLATVMKEVNGLQIHISTDYLFGKESYNTHLQGGPGRNTNWRLWTY